ncbi:alpha/beta hydrolase [Agromyces indicus]|uniref:Alpha/beta fold hydrolase n=1 Tax=Agromyces indicus TaxID=758919 RepID=A0ABU1FJ68_9MICO|nr:alpha/beta fold hydrolase [Agromyces indicus]MDR5691372.1 alpha/beta fold hydrolase [Agromyces indicus]
MITASTPTLTETAFDVAVGDVRLAGTLALPAGAPRAAALLVPGSGPVDRDSDHPRMRLGITRELAHALAGAGVATLRYDKRGVGASGGDFLSAGLSDNTTDAAAALSALRERLPGVPVVLVGHSEGAIIATRLAANEPDLAGTVLLAAPAVVGERMLAWQTRQIVPTMPRLVRGILRLLRIDLVEKQRRNVERFRQSTTDVIRLEGRRMNAKWHRELIAYDPAPDLARLSMPVLAITGDHDLQVDPDDLDRIAATVAGPVEIERPERLTHLLRRDAGDTASFAAYRSLVKQPVDRELLDRVSSWVAARGRATDGGAAGA